MWNAWRNWYEENFLSSSYRHMPKRKPKQIRTWKRRVKKTEKILPRKSLHLEVIEDDATYQRKVKICFYPLIFREKRWTRISVCWWFDDGVVENENYKIWHEIGNWNQNLIFACAKKNILFPIIDKNVFLWTLTLDWILLHTRKVSIFND